MQLVPIFETARLLLRSLTINDTFSYNKYFADYDVVNHLIASVPWPYPKDAFIDYFESVVAPGQGVNRWSWGIELKENPGEIIGAVELWRDGKPEHRGFWLGKKFWNKGYMTEAVEPVMRYAFTVQGFEKLIFTNAVGNFRSRRVKEKTGCRFVGVEPASFVNPKYTENEIWELTKSSWLSHKKK